jgi:hypothetical protein
MVEEEIFRSKIDKKQPPPTFLLPADLSLLFIAARKTAQKHR